MADKNNAFVVSVTGKFGTKTYIQFADSPDEAAEKVANVVNEIFGGRPQQKDNYIWDDPEIGEYRIEPGHQLRTYGVNCLELDRDLSQYMLLVDKKVFKDTKDRLSMYEKNFTERQKRDSEFVESRKNAIDNFLHRPLIGKD